MAGNEISSHLPIGPQGVGGAKPQVGPAAKPPQGEASFKDMLVKSLEEVNRLQTDAHTAVERWATGQTQNVTEMLGAVQKADLAFKTLMQIRNKLIDAYEEIRQMRI
jgi:flagellar hook-basal body complex protein FliE